MRLICRSIDFACVVGVLAAFSTAQGQIPSAQSSEPKNISQAAAIETRFDSAKNETTVGFRLLLIIGTETDKLLISAEAKYATQTPKKHPEVVTFIISVLNKTGYKYPDGLALNITADGNRLSPVLLGNLVKRTSEGVYYETLVSLMKYDVFMRLATAKEANLEFSQTSFALKDKHLAKLRELADHLHQ